MLTSSPDTHDRDHALAFRSVTSYITKPIDVAAARAIATLAPRADAPSA